MTHDPTIAAARSERDAAKARMHATLEETKDRLSPSTLAEHAVDGIKGKANTLAADGVAVARKRPGAAAAAGAAVFLFLIRRPLIGWFKKPRRHADEQIADRQIANRQVEAGKDVRPVRQRTFASEPVGVTAKSSL